MHHEISTISELLVIQRVSQSFTGSNIAVLLQLLFTSIVAEILAVSNTMMELDAAR